MKKFLLLLIALVTSLTAWAQTFTVECNGNQFIIKRSGSNLPAQTVRYRTVSLSALAGVHFTDASDTLNFGAGEKSRTVTVTEKTSFEEVYRFQTTTDRTYRFEVLEYNGTFLASVDRSIEFGSNYQHTASYVNKSVTDLVYFDNSGNIKSGSGNKYLDVSYSSSSWIQVDDGGYSQAVHTVSTDNLFHSSTALRTYLNNQSNKVYATVYFQQMEEQDGYQYIQILADNSTSYDGNDPNGAVNDPSTSLYKACFILSYDPSGSVMSDTHYQFFPHRYDYVDKAAETSAGITHYEFDYDNSHLYQQKYKSSSYNAANNGALNLATSVKKLNVRFDAAGSGGDDWDFKNLKVRLALVDEVKPSPVASNAQVSSGPYASGVTVYVSVPFSEIVTATSSATLTTSWGTLSYFGGSGSNVLTFSGNISAAVGTQLTISALSSGITDLAGNTLSTSSVYKQFNATVIAKHAITISSETVHGTVTSDKATAIAGETVTLTATPDAGYVFGSFIVMAGGTVVQTTAGENGTCTFTMPAAPVTVTATFVAIPFAINLPESFEHGTVTCEQATAIAGETVTLTVTPEAGYGLETLSVMAGETSIETTAGENGTYTFTMPFAPVTVTATFISGKEITVHDGTDYNDYVPVNSFYTNNYQKSEVIYPAAELAEINGLYITQLTYYLQLQSNKEWTEARFKVYLREVEQTDYSGGAAFLGFSDEDLVYEGPLSGTAPTMVIPLDNPYLYNGGNLLVGVYLPNPGSPYDYAFANFYGETAANAAVRGLGFSTFDGITARIENFRPKTTFCSQFFAQQRPTQVTADNITATSATVGWTENSGATAWQLCVDGDEEHLIDTNENPCTLTGLAPDAEHTIRVRSVDGVAHSAWSVPATFTTLELVNKPAELTVQLTPGDGTVATLSWTERGNASSWQVSLNGDEENPISANENPFTLTGLTPETRYTARVRALDGNGDHSNWSNPVTFTPFNSLTYLVHDGEESKDNVPVNGYFVSGFQKCESIYPAGELATIDGYYITQLTYYLQSQAEQEWAGAQFKVYLREVEQADYSGGAAFLGFSDDDLVYEGPLSGTAPTMVIPFNKAYRYQGGNLLVGVYLSTTGAYSYSSFYGETVANASVRGGTSSSFDDINGGIVDFLPKIAFGLSNFSIIDVTTTTALLSLINTGSATAWQVCLNGDEQNPLDVTENPFTLTGLTPDTEYTVQIRGNYSYGFSAWSVPMTFTTLELVNKPADLTVMIDPENATTAILSWTERGSATAWQLCLNGDEENLIDVTTNPYTLKNLTLGTEYTACVRALDGNGNHSGWSNTVTFVPIMELTVHDVSEPYDNEYVPVYGYYVDWYQKSECIYPAAELASITDADITQLTYYLAKQANWEWTNARFKVYLREVEQTEFGEDVDDFLGFDEGDLVYEGELSGTAPTMVIPFDTPYTYHGGNLLVGIYEVQTSDYYFEASFLGEQVETISSMMGYNEYSLDEMEIDSRLSFLPKTTFGYLREMGVTGDVNGDGEVTTVDITAIYNYLLNGDETFIATSDVDGDGFITTTDITVIYNILLGSKK